MPQPKSLWCGVRVVQLTFLHSEAYILPLLSTCPIAPMLQLQGSSNLAHRHTRYSFESLPFQAWVLPLFLPGSKPHTLLPILHSSAGILQSLSLHSVAFVPPLHFPWSRKGVPTTELALWSAIHHNWYCIPKLMTCPQLSIHCRSWYIQMLSLLCGASGLLLQNLHSRFII